MVYIANIIDSLAWPITILLLGYLFKKEFNLLIGRVSTLKYKDLQADFKNTLNEVENEAKKFSYTKDNKTIMPDYKNERYIRLMSLAEVSPRGAILEAWIEIETELFKLCKRADFKNDYKNSFLLIRDLISNNIIPADILPLLDGLMKIRNKAVHLPDFFLDDEDKRYLNIAIGISNLLETLDGKKYN